MKNNPEIIFYDEGYAIRFVLRSWTTLMWIQDIFCDRKLKSNLVDRPVVIFSTKEEAKEEIINTVIPYIKSRKKEYTDDIVGW